MLSLVELSPEEIERVVAAVPGGAANIQDIYPLAPLQEGFLFHHALTSKGDLYIMETQFGFDSRERLDRYLEALQWVVDRNDIMRTAYVWEGLREPVQVVCRKAPLIIEELILDPADGDIAQQLSARYNLLNYRIDISVPPMVRIFVAHDAPNNRWVYHQLTHHLMDDQASVNFQEEEIQAYLHGEPSKLPSPQPFRNYVAQAKLGVSLKEQEAFFRKLLGDVEEPTAPFGLTDVLGNGSRIEEARAFLDPILSRRLFETGQRIGASTASLFHLAWAQMLARLSGREEVVFATCLLGRMNAAQGADRLLGPCINTVPMRLSLGDASILEGVRETHTLLAQLLRHEHAPLALAQRCSAVGPNIPAFNSILNYRRPSRGVGRQSQGLSETGAKTKASAKNVKVTEWFSEEIKGREFIRFLERTNYPLTLSVDDFGEGFRLVAQVQSPPINPQRICDYMRTALEQLAGALESAPNASLRTLDVLPDAERNQLLHEWNDTKADYPACAPIHRVVEAQVDRAPERTAVKFGAITLSYIELERRANRIAHVLRSHGVGRGQRVGLCFERGVEMIAALLGILKAGAAYVPFDPGFPRERLRFMAQDAELTWLVSTSDLAGNFDLPRERQLLLDIDAAVLASHPDRRLTADAALDARSEDPAYMIYTSGSTGKPKGVVVQHRAVVNFLTSMAREPGMTADDVIVAVTTPSFDIAVLELQLPLTVGAAVVIAHHDEIMDGHALRGLLEEHRATVMQGTPITWRLLLEAGWKGERAIKALVGGEAMPKDLADELIACGVELWNMYGPTETTVWSTCARITDTSNGITIGKPIANTTVYVLDAEKNLCPIGVPGELYIGGAGVTMGYWNRPEFTAEQFIPDPFGTTPGATLYRTGDRARWRNDGALDHLGRFDDQIKIRGFRIELGEIEAKLSQHPAVGEAVVLAREDKSGDKQLLAYYVRAPDAEAVDAQALRRHLWAALPGYMVPAVYVRLDALPLTANGKLNGKALPVPGDAAYAARGYEAPANEIEMLLARIWAEVLNLERVGPNDNFFELGGHSLLALRLVGRVRSTLGTKIGIDVLFRAPTLREFAACLSRANVDPLTEAWGIVEIQPLGKKAPIIAINNTMIYRNLAQKIGVDRRFLGVQLFDPNNPRPLPSRSLNEIAADYVNLIREAQPHGPYVLMGFCVAGLIAHEAAQQLRQGGEQVPLVIMADSSIDHRPFVQRLLRDWDFRFRNYRHRFRLLRSGKARLTDILVEFWR